jgi:methionyl-tRNA formyltransferase
MKGDETTPSLEKALSLLASSKLEEVCLGVASGALRGVPQDPAAATVSKKIKKQDGSLVWREDSTSILRKVRAYQPWPGVTFRMTVGSGAHLVKIVEASEAGGSGEAGRILKADHRELTVACGRGAISIRRLTPEGKREMSVSDFLHGARLQTGGILLDGPPRNDGGGETPRQAGASIETCQKERK